jgi:hypothetical protein
VAQINLLSNETTRTALPWETLLAVLVRLFAIVFFLCIGYYGYLWYSTRSLAGKIIARQNSISQIQREILNHTDRKELLIRQGQISELEKLLASHTHWSKFFPELARITLKSASYVALSTEESGLAKISVVVPSYSDFASFLTVFEQPEFHEKFNDVKVIAVTKYQASGISGVKFDIEVAYDEKLLTEQE